MGDTRLIHRILTDDRVEKWRARWFWVNAPTALLALASFLLFHGEVFPQRWESFIALFQALCLIVLIGETVGVFLLARNLKDGWKQAPGDTLALLVGALMGLILFVISPWGAAYIDESTTFTAFAYLTQAGLLCFVSLRLLRVLSFVTRLVQSPLHVFLGSFAGLILVGAGLLMLPGAHAPGQEVTFLDAVFTATSATCVTGLSVLDTGTAWTRFGQLVIITLVQMGGLGIMTFAAFFGLAFGRGMGVKGAAAVGEVMNLDLIGRVGRVTVWILGTTLVCEGLGVFLLYGHWVDAAGNALPVGEQLYYSMFHSISAFCNAGFSLYSDSMVRYVGHWPMVLSISWLVIMGGLGFTAIMEVTTFRFWAHPWARRVSFIKRRVKGQPIPRLSLQSKIILSMTVMLLLVGTVGMLVLEWNYTLKSLDWDDKLAAALFQSMAARTAGFNSVDTPSTSTATQFWTILLMIVGGSPGSVAGGIKTTTFFVMILSVAATFSGRPTEAFRRRIPESLIRKSLVMLVLAMVFICTATLALCVTEVDHMAGEYYGFEHVLFEAASAFCTVGLSSGMSSELTPAGRIIIIACMYTGRIGPLTLVLAIGRKAQRKFEYPEENIMIG
ncbi:MAG: Trk family potassium uptake protein [Planctomycetes bacterium]|nr:Trk family potassium uptake protein [Planctomycetota bacterium]